MYVINRLSSWNFGLLTLIILWCYSVTYINAVNVVKLKSWKFHRSEKVQQRALDRYEYPWARKLSTYSTHLECERTRQWRGAEISAFLKRKSTSYRVIDNIPSTTKRGGTAPYSLPPANEVCEGYLFTHVCHSVHGGRGGVVSQHAAQVTWPNTIKQLHLWSVSVGNRTAYR